MPEEAIVWQMLWGQKLSKKHVEIWKSYNDRENIYFVSFIFRIEQFKISINENFRG